ncbi:MAG: protein kinase domain-containing protein, partial [Thermoguttaceae bacterium]
MSKGQTNTKKTNSSDDFNDPKSYFNAEDTVGSAKFNFSASVLIDQLCDEFESGWQSNRPVSIEILLAKVPHGLRSALLRELLEIEIEYRHSNKQEINEREYFTRFPESTELVQLILRKIVRRKRIGDYELIEQIGKGGMGIVYRARQVFLNQTVAVKILPHQYTSDPQVISRFRREMQLIGGLNHPNIVRAFNAGESQGTLYLAMEFVDGTNLQQIVKTYYANAKASAKEEFFNNFLSNNTNENDISENDANINEAKNTNDDNSENKTEKSEPVSGENAKNKDTQTVFVPFPIGAASEVIRQASLGLEHAYESGLIHRDIKPANLMLTQNGLVKILDLGLGKFRAENRFTEINEPTLTKFGATMGTIDYMAPEQWENASDVDIRADIYSLGCTMFFMLTGHAPFDGPEYTSNRKKLLAHVEGSIPSVETFRTDCPPAFLEIMAKMIAKEPQERFQAPKELTAAITPFCNSLELKAIIDVMPSPESFRQKEQSNISSVPAFSLDDCDTLRGGLINGYSAWEANSQLPQTHPMIPQRKVPFWASYKAGILILLFLTIGITTIGNTSWLKNNLFFAPNQTVGENITPENQITPDTQANATNTAGTASPTVPAAGSEARNVADNQLPDKQKPDKQSAAPQTNTASIEQKQPTDSGTNALANGTTVPTTDTVVTGTVADAAAVTDATAGAAAGTETITAADNVLPPVTLPGEVANLTEKTTPGEAAPTAPQVAVTTESVTPTEPKAVSAEPAVPTVSGDSQPQPANVNNSVNAAETDTAQVTTPHVPQEIPQGEITKNTDTVNSSEGVISVSNGTQPEKVDGEQSPTPTPAVPPETPDQQAQRQAAEAIAQAEAQAAQEETYRKTVRDLVELPGLGGQWWFVETPWYLPIIREKIDPTLEAGKGNLPTYCATTLNLSGDTQTLPYSSPNVPSAQEFLWKLTKLISNDVPETQRQLVDELYTSLDAPLKSDELACVFTSLVSKFEESGPLKTASEFHTLALLQHRLAQLQNDLVLAEKAKGNYQEAIKLYNEQIQKEKLRVENTVNATITANVENTANAVSVSKERINTANADLLCVCLSDSARLGYWVDGDFEAFKVSAADILKRENLSDLFKIEFLATYGDACTSADKNN